MKKQILLMMLCLVTFCNISNATFFKATPITTYGSDSAVLITANNQTVASDSKHQPKTITLIKQKIKKYLPEYTVGDGYDLFAVIGFVSLLLSFFTAIAFIIALIGTTASAPAFGLLIISFLFSLISLTSTIIAGIRFKENKKLKGKGFLYASGFYWGLSILQLMVAILVSLLQQ